MIKKRRIPADDDSPLGVCLYFVLFMVVGISGQCGVREGSNLEIKHTLKELKKAASSKHRGVERIVWCIRFVYCKMY